MKKALAILALLVGLNACNEAPLISGDASPRLNSPVSIVRIPGTDLAVVANANVNLEQPNGWLVGVDLNSRQLLSDTFLSIPNFAGRMVVDSARSRLYVVDRGNDALLVFTYSVPGSNGKAISFEPVIAPVPADLVPYGVETDDSPFDVLLATGTVGGDRLFVTNAASGTVSVIGADSLEPIDFDEDPLLNGFPLISASNYRSVGRKPGAGANRLVVNDFDSRLFFVTSTVSNQIYVIDREDLKVEAMIDLSSLATGGGTRGMVVDSTGRAFVVHRGLGGVLVLDLSGVRENGVDMEVVDPPFVDFIPTGSEPDGMVWSWDRTKLFVTHQGDNSIVVIDAATRLVRNRIYLTGSVPGDILSDDTAQLLYVTNLLSDNISIVDQAAETEVGTIP